MKNIYHQIIPNTQRYQIYKVYSLLHKNIVKLRSRSGEGQVKVSGEGQVRVRKVRYLDLSYTLFLVFNIDSGSLNIDSGSHTNF